MIVVIIVIAVIGLIIYNTNFNLKHSEGDKIMVEFKKEKNIERKSRMRVSGAEKLQKFKMAEKYAVLSSLVLIMKGSDFESNKESQKQRIEDLRITIDMDENAWKTYESISNRTNLKFHLSTLTKYSKESYLDFVMGFISLDGLPSDNEIAHTNEITKALLDYSLSEYMTTLN